MAFPRLAMAIAAALGAGATLACYAAAGPDLGLFFGGFFVATCVVPAAMLAGREPADVLAKDNWIMLAAVVASIAAVWLLAVMKTADTAGQWLAVTAALAAYALLLWGIVAMLDAIGPSQALAYAGAAAFGLAWLAWPVWLSGEMQHLQGNVVQGMVDVNPPLVANGVLRDEPPWPENVLAYQLTDLNQDVAVVLPASAGACAGAQAGIGILLLGASALILRFKMRRRPCPGPLLLEPEPPSRRPEQQARG